MFWMTVTELKFFFLIITLVIRKHWMNDSKLLHNNCDLAFTLTQRLNNLFCCVYCTNCPYSIYHFRFIRNPLKICRSNVEYYTIWLHPFIQLKICIHHLEINDVCCFICFGYVNGIIQSLEIIFRIAASISTQLWVIVKSDTLITIHGLIFKRISLKC